MAILKKEQLLAKLKAKIGEDVSDETISLIEDFTDTYSDLETKTKNTTEWEQKYKDNDTQWRKKYSDRFLNTEVEEETKPTIPVENKTNLSFENLFNGGTK